MSKHYVEAYSQIVQPAGISNNPDDWRVWYTREYSDGLKSCHTRIANLSQKYPNTLFRIRTYDSNNFRGNRNSTVLSMLAGQRVTDNLQENLAAVQVAVWGTYDRQLRHSETYMVANVAEFWDWSQSHFSGKFIRVTCGSPSFEGYFSRPEKNRKAEIVDKSAISAETERLAALKRADEASLLPSNRRGFAFTENMNVLTRQQLAAISARSDLSGVYEYLKLLADDFAAVAGAMSGKSEKHDLVVLAEKIRELGL